MSRDDREFRLDALFDALDAQRRVRKLSWVEVSAEAGGIAVSTITGIGTKKTAEGDGVLQLLRWLNRSPESFVPALAAGSHAWRPLPTIDPKEKLRFDTPKLYAALDAERRKRGLSWQRTADELGGFRAAMLTRLAKPGRVAFPQVMRLTQWLERPAIEFTTRGR